MTENRKEEDRLLQMYGLHVAYDHEGEEVWQLGSSGNETRDPEFFTREGALAYVKERLHERGEEG